VGEEHVAEERRDVILISGDGVGSDDHVYGKGFAAVVQKGVAAFH
jgi:hypothetical protein